VHLDLIDGRHNLRRREQRIQVPWHEVAHADRANATVGEELLECSVGGECLVELVGQRLMEDQEIDGLDAKLPCALVEGVERLVVAVVADP
jgi:hypothetical protein